MQVQCSRPLGPPPEGSEYRVPQIARINNIGGGELKHDPGCGVFSKFIHEWGRTAISQLAAQIRVLSVQDRDSGSRSRCCPLPVAPLSRKSARLPVPPRRLH